MSSILQLVECRRNARHDLSLPTVEERDKRERETPHESGWDQTEWEVNVQECKKARHLNIKHFQFPNTFLRSRVVVWRLQLRYNLTFVCTKRIHMGQQSPFSSFSGGLLVSRIHRSRDIPCNIATCVFSKF